AARYRAALAEKSDLAVWAAEQIAGIPGIVMDAPPQLSLFAFHLESAVLNTLDAQNAATRALMGRVTRRGKVMLTGASIGERYLGRVCVLGFRNRRDTLETCVRHLAEETAALLARQGAPQSPGVPIE
ncbi:MAG: hypothetical protein L0H19_06940, partial [Salinisphaera sp.]|nr:hypothetical protein [Salinisphaera sp.]